MRFAIFMGLILVAWAINYDIVDPLLRDSIPINVFIVLLLIIDLIEWFVKMFKSKL
jgi:hypothetical protein